jgi:hypothetical protein
VGLSKTKDIDVVRAQAEELETLLATETSCPPASLMQAVHALSPNSFQQSSSANPPSPFQPQGPQNSSYFQSNNQQQSERHWNNRPICNYCNRVGHTYYTCEERREDLLQEYQESDFHGSTDVPSDQRINSLQQQHEQQVSSTVTVEVNELVRAIAGLGTKDKQPH